jgi:hypothetical protein
MLDFQKFRSLCGNPQEVSQKELFLLWKSFKRSMLLGFLPEKKFGQNEEAEVKLQKDMLKKLETSATGKLIDLILRLKFDDIMIDVEVLEKKILPTEKHLVLFNKRMDRYEAFLEISDNDREELKKIAERYQRIREKKDFEKTKTGWKVGIGAAVLALGAAYTYKSVKGKVRDKTTEKKKGYKK